MGEPKYPSSCVERFLAYVQVDTQSSESSESFPSTAKQLGFQRRLVGELRELGLDDAELDEHGYVFATIPATTTKPNVPVVGFIAHVDTSPEVSGEGVKPIVHCNYRGQDIVLPDDPSVVIRLRDNPALEEQLGSDIITASGTTLLGADNKAGVAEIVGAAEALLARPDIPHGKIRIGFTPDEEVGRGTEHFDVERFGASCAYTMDGETVGQLQTETFSADTLVVTFHGFNAHPGFAKGRMVNAMKVAADFIRRLPDECAPENTAGSEGFVHPWIMEPGVERTIIKLIVRDFDTARLAVLEKMVIAHAEEAAAARPGARVDFEVLESYRNMKQILDRHPDVVDNAAEAIRRAGLEVRRVAIRGGTDGSRLCTMGLPTPNIFAGEHNFHSREEWVSTGDMHKAVEVIVELARVWEEKAPG